MNSNVFGWLGGIRDHQRAAGTRRATGQIISIGFALLAVVSAGQVITGTAALAADQPNNGHSAAGRVPGVPPQKSLAAIAAPSAYPITGVDVSNLQGSINWAAVAGSGQRFAYLKASEGIQFVDRYFTANN